MITIVLADDHPIVRSGLRALLGSIDGFQVVAEAEDGHAAIREAVTHRPDVLVMDIQMPGLDGIEATRRVAEAAPDVAVLMLTMYEDDASVFAAMRAGARGYLLKGAQQQEIARAIHAVADGQAIFGPGVARHVLAFFTGPATATPPVVPDRFPELTDRETQILDLIAAGRPNGEIARRLAISPKTVANHVSSIFAKLQVADRTAAALRARDAGLGRP
ncbi:response regulator [Yinghuangia seranimata]|uniref:response regulator n=1 Tax=Yinghuangia seranimata TaxID=408067 RepID=UPI00248C8720|nr:response regulator transcription factor [Yinghuangia seranimata]MDI2126501.1 response regulator transcription factor [Yinghuangia seranimata]